MYILYITTYLWSGCGIGHSRKRGKDSQGKGLGFNEQTQEKLREFDFGR